MNRESIGNIEVLLPDKTVYQVNKLLGEPNSNTKLRKSQGAYRVVGLSLAPHKSSGKNVCPMSSPGCIASCIYHSGLAQVFDSVKRARIAKTIAFFKHREKFLIKLWWELYDNVKKAEANNQKLAVRLNVFSDIPWEKMYPTYFIDFPEITFFDYTKIPDRLINPNLPKNYHLTFSRSETNEADCLRLLGKGKNVTVVFRDKNLPKRWKGYKVITGDDTDLRFLDKSPRVIGLYSKGPGKYDETGFVVENK